MKNRYEVKGTIDGKNRNSGFCETIEQALATTFIFQLRAPRRKEPTQ